jgi:hypothetical protein
VKPFAGKAAVRSIDDMLAAGFDIFFGYLRHDHFLIKIERSVYLK